MTSKAHLSSCRNTFSCTTPFHFTKHERKHTMHLQWVCSDTHTRSKLAALYLKITCKTAVFNAIICGCLLKWSTLAFKFKCTHLADAFMHSLGIWDMIPDCTDAVRLITLILQGFVFLTDLSFHALFWDADRSFRLWFQSFTSLSLLTDNISVKKKQEIGPENGNAVEKAAIKLKSVCFHYGIKHLF